MRERRTQSVIDLGITVISKTQTISLIAPVKLDIVTVFVKFDRFEDRFEV